jgi:DNA-binding MarR family transcriptional regulator
VTDPTNRTDPTDPRWHEWVESHDPETMPLLLNLHLAQAQAIARARAVWRRHGLAAAEFDVLASLRSAAPPRELTPSQLQAALVITSGGLTKVMRQLEARGLVERSRQQIDQRVKPIKLTPSGKRLVEKAMAELSAAAGASIRSLLTADEMAMLSALLAKLVASDAGAR